MKARPSGHVPADMIWSPPGGGKYREWGRDLTPAMGHHFDQKLRCECGVGWYAHRHDPYPCTRPRTTYQQWYDRYMAGESFVAIAKDVGRHESAVRRAVQRRIAKEQE